MYPSYITNSCAIWPWAKAFNLSVSNKYQFIYNILWTNPSEMFENNYNFLNIYFFKVIHYINTK